MADLVDDEAMMRANKAVDELAIEEGTQLASYSRYSDGRWSELTAPVPTERALTIYVNKIELITLLCTPTKLTCLVIGFLYSEGIISSPAEVASLRVCEDEAVAEVRLTKDDYSPPTRRFLTSGCGGGGGFGLDQELPGLDSGLTVSPDQVFSLMRQLQQGSRLYRACGGVHSSALCDPNRLLMVAEDVARHNTLDKIQGEALLMGIPTRDRLLLTTGRISSEMLAKAARMATPVVVSRTSPTRRAISLAERLGIALIGYVRGQRLSVYSHAWRVRGDSGQVIVV